MRDDLIKTMAKEWQNSLDPDQLAVLADLVEDEGRLDIANELRVLKGDALDVAVAKLVYTPRQYEIYAMSFARRFHPSAEVYIDFGWGGHQGNVILANYAVDGNEAFDIVSDPFLKEYLWEVGYDVVISDEDDDGLDIALVPNGKPHSIHDGNELEHSLDAQGKAEWASSKA